MGRPNKLCDLIVGLLTLSHSSPAVCLNLVGFTEVVTSVCPGWLGTGDQGDR